MAYPKASVVDGKKWIASIQKWSWIITVAWMTIANFWHPFGLFGFVCMFTPIVIAFTGRGKMSCARICPRGSFIGLVTRKISIGLSRPAFTYRKWFHFTLWCLMMGSFMVMLILVVPKGISALGFAVLVFMEVATALAILSGILFTPRAWCTYCPMGFSTGNIRNFLKRRDTNE